MQVICFFFITIFPFSLAARWDNCSRDRSRYARQIIEKTIMPSVKLFGVHLPDSCPLRQMNDFFAHQDKMIVVNSAQDFECSDCGKRFRESRFLSNHFTHRHNTSIIDTKDTVCLAEYCQLLRCDVFHEEIGSISLLWRAVLCREEDVANLLPQCNDLLEKCSTGSGPNDLKWTETIKKILCDPLTCDVYWKKPEDDKTIYAGGQWVAVILGIIGYFVAIGIRIVRIDSQKSNY